MRAHHTPWVTVWMPALAGVAAIALAGCPVALPADPQVSFHCESSDQCATGQLCRDHQCVGASASVDASGQLLDANPGDAIASDLVRDAQLGDRSAIDAVADRSTAPDRATSDAVHTDVAATPDQTTPDAMSADACTPPSGPAWWNAAYALRYPLSISAAADHYTLQLELASDATAPILAAALASGDDVRIVHHAASATELDRDRAKFDSNGVNLLFRVQESGGYPGGDQTYYLYLGNPAAGPPPTDPRNIYLFFEDFEGMASEGTGAPVFSTATAEWSVDDEGGNHVYRVNSLSSGARTPAEIVGLSATGARFAGFVKYDSVNAGNTGYTGLAFGCSDVTSATTTCTGGAVRDASDQSGIMSWTGGVFDSFGSFSSTYSPVAGLWYHYQVSFVGSNATFQIGGAVQETSEIALTGSALALVGVGVSAAFDDVIIRRLADPEPAVRLGAIQQRCQ